MQFHKNHLLNLVFPRISFLFLMLSTFSTKTISQEKWAVVDGSSVEILGTSTLHDWSAQSVEIEGFGILSLTDELRSIDQFSFSIQVKSLKSDKSTLNDKMYRSLDADKYPMIYFELQKAKIDKNAIQAIGTLKISGKSKVIEGLVEYEIQRNQIIFKGTKALDMTEWGIDPPVMFLGTIKTNKEVLIDYKIICQLEK